MESPRQPSPLPRPSALRRAGARVLPVLWRAAVVQVMVLGIATAATRVDARSGIAGLTATLSDLVAAPLAAEDLGTLGLLAVGIAGFLMISASALRKLAVPMHLAVPVVAALALGSRIDVPFLTVSTETAVGLVHFDRFVYFQPSQVTTTMLSANVTGALVPLAASLFILFMTRGHRRTALTVGLLTGVAAYLTSQVVPTEGAVLISPLPPAVVAAVGARLGARADAPRVALAATVLGVLIGADVARLPALLDANVGRLSFGGGGLADAVFLAGLAAAYLVGSAGVPKAGAAAGRSLLPMRVLPTKRSGPYRLASSGGEYR